MKSLGIGKGSQLDLFDFLIELKITYTKKNYFCTFKIVFHLEGVVKDVFFIRLDSIKTENYQFLMIILPK
jgi:hypothetical protein